MKSYAVTEWGRPLQSVVLETPAPTGRRVLLRVTHCGVCHTDVHVREGYFDLGGGNRFSLGDRGVKLPHTVGHEIAGVVAAIGDEAEGVRVGETYLVNPWIGCGTCAMCAAGLDNLCQNMSSLGISAPGGFSSHVLVPDTKYLVNIDGLDTAKAAPLACSGLTTFCAVKKLLPMDPGDWVAVLGCGGLGLMAISVLHGFGYRRVIACDIDDKKLEAAKSRGAAETCNLQDGGSKRIAEIAGGGLYGMLDFVGAPSTLALAAPCLRKGGKFVVCGLFGGAASIPIAVLPLREIAILGSLVGTTRELIELVALAKRGQIQLGDVERRPMSAAERSLSDLAGGRVIGRVVLEAEADSDRL